MDRGSDESGYGLEILMGYECTGSSEQTGLEFTLTV